jgi:hypothetical protein
MVSLQGKCYEYTDGGKEKTVPKKEESNKGRRRILSNNINSIRMSQFRVPIIELLLNSDRIAYVHRIVAY